MAHTDYMDIPPCAIWLHRGSVLNVIASLIPISNGGNASRVGETKCTYLAEFGVYLFIHVHSPTRDASPPLEVAFGAHFVFRAKRLSYHATASVHLHIYPQVYTLSSPEKIALPGFCWVVNGVTALIINRLTSTNCQCFYVLLQSVTYVQMGTKPAFHASFASH